MNKPSQQWRFCDFVAAIQVLRLPYLLIRWLTAKMFIPLFVWQRNHSLFGPVGLQSTASVNDSELNALSWSMDEPTHDRRQSLAHSTSYGGFVYGWTDRFRDSIG